MLKWKKSGNRRLANPHGYLKGISHSVFPKQNLIPCHCRARPDRLPMRATRACGATIHPVVQAPSLWVSCPASSPSANLVSLAPQIFPRCSHFCLHSSTCVSLLPSLPWTIAGASCNPLSTERLERLCSSIDWMSGPLLLTSPCWRPLSSFSFSQHAKFFLVFCTNCSPWNVLFVSSPIFLWLISPLISWCKIANESPSVSFSF